MEYTIILLETNRDLLLEEYHTKKGHAKNTNDLYRCKALLNEANRASIRANELDKAIEILKNVAP